MGYYQAIVDGQVVATATTSREAYDLAKAMYPNKRITLSYVPQEVRI
jgi:hypothetical protein